MADYLNANLKKKPESARVRSGFAFEDLLSMVTMLVYMMVECALDFICGATYSLVN